MDQTSPKEKLENDAIVNAYIKQKGEEKAALLSKEAVIKDNNEKERDAEAQEMVEKIFVKADQIDEVEYQKILTLEDLKRLINNSTPKSLEAAGLHLIEQGKSLEEVLGLLKNMVSGVDHITGLQNKAALSDTLRQTTIDIISTKDEHQRTEKMRRSGMIYFDVRGLKMVNDARQRHADGDAFITMVADETKVVAEQIFAKIVGDQAVAGIFRDGGDEFAIAFQDSKHDLEAPVTLEIIDEIIPETITVTRKDGSTQDMDIRNIAKTIFESPTLNPGSGEMKLINLLSKMLEAVLYEQKFVSDMFPREVIEAHLKKGSPNYHNEALAEFDMPILIAQGAQSNYEVFKKTKEDYYKDKLTTEQINNLKAPGLVNILMSAMRYSADKKSYETKNTQNRTWMRSSDPLDRLLIDLVSRNEITVSYAESLRLTTDVILDLHFENKDLKKERLELYEAGQAREIECNKIKDKLDKALQTIEAQAIELAEARKVMDAVKVEKDRQLNPDLTNGGGI